jgi:hypothetical protein
VVVSATKIAGLNFKIHFAAVDAVVEPDANRLAGEKSLRDV